MTLEERLEQWLRQPGTCVTREERTFIEDMRKARAAGVGYGWMQQIIEWEWQSKDPKAAWGPEKFEQELIDAMRGTRAADPDAEARR